MLFTLAGFTENMKNRCIGGQIYGHRKVDMFITFGAILHSNNPHLDVTHFD